jgi:formyl-CoA transferase
MVASIDHPTLGSYRGVARPIKFGRTPGPAPFAAPVLGQDTAQVIAAVDAGAPIAPKPRGRRKA